MRSARRLLILALVAAVLTPLLPAAAVAQTPPPTFDPGTGLDARIAAVLTLAELNAGADCETGGDQGGGGANGLPCGLDSIVAGLDTVTGDAVSDRATFDFDRKAATQLNSLWHGNGKDPAVAAAVVEVLEQLVLADRIAALRTAEVVAEFPDELLSDGKGTNKTPVADQILALVEKGDEQAAGGNYQNAFKWYGDAWELGSGAFFTYLANIDADGDLIPDDREIALGTDPNGTDTDGDNLADSVELLVTFTDPLQPDTFDTGVTDDLLDLDLDGASNADELLATTDPVNPDSDGDGLDDGFEIFDYPSSPLLADTDADGLEDDSEFRIGTDPTNPDTDGDGILDGDETYTTTAADPEAGFEVSITGVGDVAETVTFSDMSEIPLYEDFPGKISGAVDINTSKAFDEVEVRIPFDPADVPNGDLDGLRIAFYDEELGRLFPLEDDFGVDAATNTAFARTDHFTTFLLFYIPAWDDFWLNYDPVDPGDPSDPKFVDVMLVIDSSGSMRWNDPLGLRKTASKNFIDALIEGDQVGVVDFDSNAVLLSGLTTDFAAAKAAVDRIDSSGGTNIGAGVAVAHNEIINNGNPEHLRAEIVLTDGVGSYSSSLTTQAVNENITMFTIGLGSGVNAGLLQGIADATGGEYFPVAQADDLPDVFSRIGGTLDPFGDADEDGLLNGWETNGMAVGTGRTITTNPLAKDSDGDGAWDSDELVIVSSDLELDLYFRMRSNPNVQDSDGDGLWDSEELDMGMDPLDEDMDDDIVFDGNEFNRGWDFTDPNPDGDRFTDLDELANDTNPFFPDPSLTDRTRAFVAGAVLGEVGYALADWGIPVTVSFVKFPPSISVGIGPLDVCNLPFVPCSELFTFEPIDVERLEYMIGLIAFSFIPLVDIVVAVRDVIGSVLQGEFGWALFEVVAGVFSVAAPGPGDALNVVGDIGKWARRVGANSSSLDELLVIINNVDEFSPAFKKRVIRELTEGAYDTLVAKGVSEDDILRLVAGRRKLAHLADALTRVGVRADSAGKWFDEAADLTRFGGEGENFIQGITGGPSKRLTAKIDGTDEFRFVDSLVEGAETVAHEVKTGDGRLTSFVRRQIRKDKDLLDRGLVDEVVWNFLPSGRSDVLGPDPRLLDELLNNGFDVVIWTP